MFLVWTCQLSSALVHAQESIWEKCIFCVFRSDSLMDVCWHSYSYQELSFDKPLTSLC